MIQRSGAFLHDENRGIGSAAAMTADVAGLRGLWKWAPSDNSEHMVLLKRREHRLQALRGDAVEELLREYLPNDRPTSGG